MSGSNDSPVMGVAILICFAIGIYGLWQTFLLFFG